MKIESLHIDGFGQFHDTTFGPFSSPVTIFNGENEAGKSTLLEFIRTIFFGFPRQGRNEFYPALNGGRHGGHIVILDEDDTRYTIERYAGAKGGTVIITDQNGAQYDEVKLHQLLGNSSKVLFREVFAFGLEELQKLDSLNDEDVQGRIYSAGLGINNLQKSREHIEQEQKKIYVQGGNFSQTQAVTAVINELEQIEKQISEHTNDANQYSDLNDEIKRLEIELHELTSNRNELNRQLEHVSKLRNVRDDLVETGILEDKLAEFGGEPKFPENGITRLEHLEEQISNLTGEIQDTNDVLAKLEAVIEEPIDRFELLEDTAAIKATVAQRGLLESAIRDIPERTAEARAQLNQLDSHLNDLGTGWDTVRLETVDISLPIRDRVDQEKALVSKLDQKITQLQVATEAAEKEFTATRHELEQATARLDQFEPIEYSAQTLERQRVAIDSSRRELLRKGQEQLRLSTLEGSGKNRSLVTGKALLLTLSILFVIAGLAGLIWGTFAGADVRIILPAASLSGLGLILGFFGFKKQDTSQASNTISQARKSLSDIEDLLSSNSEILNMDQVDLDSLELAEKHLSTRTSRLEERQTLETTLAKAVTDNNQRMQILTRSKEELERALDDRLEAATSWAGWLTERGMPDHMSPNGISDLFTKINEAQSIYSNQREAKARVSAIEKDISEVYDLVSPLARRHKVNINQEQSTTIIPAIDMLSELLEKAQNNENAREQQRINHAQTSEQLDSETRRLKQLTDDLSRLLSLSDANDTEDFRTLGVNHARYTEYKKSLESHRLTVFRIFGQDALVGKLRSEAIDPSGPGLEQKIEDLNDFLQQNQDTRDELTKQITIARQNLTNLGSSEETTALMAQREALTEELRDLALQWTKYTIALTMLDRAKNRYERERQPKVIQRASEFFYSVTKGRYTGLRSTVGDDTIMAVTPSGATKTVNQLSRGTREQMYLALRFGLIQEFSENTASLPIIFDDALVNSDPHRARAVVDEFVKLTQHNQVLVFTCHPTFVQQFTDAYPESDIQELHRMVG